MSQISYTANVVDEDGDPIMFDLRTLDSDRLNALRIEAGSAGDKLLVSVIDAILAERGE